MASVAIMTCEQIASIVTALGGIRPFSKTRTRPTRQGIYSQLGPRLTYQPGQRIVRAEAHLDQTPIAFSTVSEGECTQRPMRPFRWICARATAMNANAD
jgi:hypothetical protein